MTAKRSEPTPTIIGSVRLSTPAVATAASIAFPPCFRICNPACAASGWLVTTIPCWAMTSERLCDGQPSARVPRTALQKAGASTASQEASVGATWGMALAPANTISNIEDAATKVDLFIIKLPHSVEGGARDRHSRGSQDQQKTLSHDDLQARIARISRAARWPDRAPPSMKPWKSYDVCSPAK